MDMNRKYGLIGQISILYIKLLLQYKFFQNIARSSSEGVRSGRDISMPLASFPFFGQHNLHLMHISLFYHFQRSCNIEKRRYQLVEGITSQYDELIIKQVSIESIKKRIKLNGQINAVQKYLVENNELQSKLAIKNQGQLLLHFQDENLVKHYYQQTLRWQICKFTGRQGHQPHEEYEEVIKMIQELLPQAEKTAIGLYINQYLSCKSRYFEQAGMFYLKSTHFKKAKQNLEIEEKICKLVKEDEQDEQRINKIQFYIFYSKIFGKIKRDPQKLKEIEEKSVNYSIFERVYLARVKCLTKLYETQKDKPLPTQQIGQYLKTMKMAEEINGSKPSYELDIIKMQHEVIKSIFPNSFKVKNYQQLIIGLKKSSEVCERLIGQKNTINCQILRQIAWNHVRQGQLFDALQYSLKEAKIKEEILEKSSFNYAIVYNIIAYTLNQLGYFELGLKYSRCYEKMMEIIKITNQDDIFYENISGAYLALGWHDALIKETQRRLQKSKKLKSSFVVGENLSILLAVYAERKEFNKAKIYVEEVITNCWMNWEGCSLCYLNMGVIVIVCRVIHFLIAFEEYQRAVQLIQDLQEKLFSSKQSQQGLSYAILLQEKGFLNLRAEKLETCEREFQHAISIWEGQYLEDHPRVAQLLGYLSQLYELKGDWKMALKKSVHALQIYEKKCGFSGPFVRIEQARQRIIQIKQKAAL